MRSLSHWGWYQFISLMHLHGVLSLKDTDYWIPCLWGECVRRIYITYRDGEPPFILYHSCFLVIPPPPKCKCKEEQTCVPFLEFIILEQMSSVQIVYSHHQGLFVEQTNVKNLELHDKLLGIFPLPKGGRAINNWRHKLNLWDRNMCWRIKTRQDTPL